jgi:hypothetical protein
MTVQLQQFCSYPGILDFQSASYSCTHGVTPGVISATSRLPPNSAAAFGDFVFSDGVNTIRLRDCKWNRQDTDTRLGGGHLYQMQFLDRRWRWANTTINGEYNLKDSRQKLVPWRVKTPTELAELCLKEMGETNYVIDMPKGLTRAEVEQFLDDSPKPGQETPPTGQNPYVMWEDENAAAALAKLCDQMGRRLVFDPITDRVIICRAGEGAALPMNQHLISASAGIQAYATPAAIGVVASKVLYQVRLALVPVGRDWDGRIVHRDDLSYRPDRRPSNGSPWDLSVPGSHADVVPNSRLDYRQARELAVQSIGRMFRIADWDVSEYWGSDSIIDLAPNQRKKIQIPWYGEVDRRQNLELTEYLVELNEPEVPDFSRMGRTLPWLPAQQRDYYDGYVRQKSARVYGSIARNCEGLWHTKIADGQFNTPTGSLVAVPFTIDPKNQLVIFQNPVYRMADSGGVQIYQAPNLVLETGVYVLNNDTYEAEKYRRWIELQPPRNPNESNSEQFTVDLTKYGFRESGRSYVRLPKAKTNIGSQDVPPRYTEWHGHADDIQYGVIGRYTYDPAADVHRLDSVDPDPYQSRVEEIADNYLIGHILEHQLEPGEQGDYNCIQPIPLDGAVQHVTWNVAIGVGARTTASRNKPHGIVILPYPVERKRENQAANAERTRLNLQSSPLTFAGNTGPAVAGIIK